MKISGFIWLDDIVQKLAWKHSVTQEEITKVFANSPRLYFVEKGNRKDENVYVAFGQTDGGRYLVVFFIYKKNRQAFILSARNMTKAERKSMERNKSSISKAETYKEIGEFWDENDLAGYWEQIEPVEFEIEIESQATYFPVETNLSTKLAAVAKRHGVSPETLLNLWIQEKTAEELAVKS